MIHIEKGPEPEAFRQWKEQNPEATYGEMPREVGLAMRNALLEEQGFVCCFCGCAIGPFDDKGEIDQIPLESIRPHNIRNAHIVPQSKDTAKTLDYGNLCASCNTSRQQAHERRQALRRDAREQRAPCLTPARGLHLLLLLRLRWRNPRKPKTHGRGAGKGKCDHLHTEAQHKLIELPERRCYVR